jgi:hypothetical protein
MARYCRMYGADWVALTEAVVPARRFILCAVDAAEARWLSW